MTVDFHGLDLQADDALLLCSDGLTNRLSDSQLVVHLQASTGAAETCGGLVAAANAAGGQENTTCCFALFAPSAGAPSALASCPPFASEGGNAVAN